LIPILRGLGSHQQIRSLCFYIDDFSEEASHAVQHLLQASTTLDHVKSKASLSLLSRICGRQ
jgi:hypothetical protein